MGTDLYIVYDRNVYLSIFINIDSSPSNTNSSCGNSQSVFFTSIFWGKFSPQTIINAPTPGKANSSVDSWWLGWLNIGWFSKNKHGLVCDYYWNLLDGSGTTTGCVYVLFRKRCEESSVVMLGEKLQEWKCIKFPCGVNAQTGLYNFDQFRVIQRYSECETVKFQAEVSSIVCSFL